MFCKRVFAKFLMLLLYFHCPMLAHRMLKYFELKYNRGFLKHYVAKQIMLVANIALDILELFIFMFYSY